MRTASYQRLPTSSDLRRAGSARLGTTVDSCERRGLCPASNELSATGNELRATSDGLRVASDGSAAKPQGRKGRKGYESSDVD